jgi:hypothetical protein
MTTEDPKPPADDPKPAARAAKPKIGDVVETGDDRHALIVGSEKVEHVDEKGRTTTVEHPLVVDLPPARRLETEHAAAK